MVVSESRGGPPPNSVLPTLSIDGSGWDASVIHITLYVITFRGKPSGSGFPSLI